MIQDVGFRIKETQIMKLVGIVACVLLLNFLIAFFHPIFADQGDLGAYPSHYDQSNPKTKSWFIYQLKPGETKEDSITVVNNSDKEVQVKVYAVDATTTSDGAFALLNENQRQTGVGSWVTLASNMITIAPRDRKDVPFTITIPQFTTVGDHAGGIIVQEATQNAANTKGLGLTIVSRVGTRIYETVPGSQILNVDISNIHYEMIDNHVAIVFTMTNKGNTILTPTGVLEIKDMLGKSIDRVTLDTLGTVFPEKPTTVVAKSMSDAPWFGEYTATITINYSPTLAIAKNITFFILVKDWKAELPIPGVLLLAVLFFLYRKIFYHAHKIATSLQITKDKQEEFTKGESGGKQEEKVDQVKMDKDTKEEKPHVQLYPKAIQPSYAALPLENVDEIFVARHLKLIGILISIAIVLVSTVFAFTLQYVALSRVQQAGASYSSITPTPEPVAPTVTPTPTSIPVSKSDMQIVVLNGTSTPGLAKTLAQKLQDDGFIVVSSGNASENVSETTIWYPLGKEDGVTKLTAELAPSYTNVSSQATSSSTFTIVLGE